jgi:hypothetical protein
MTRQEFIDALNQKFYGRNYSFSLDKPGGKFTRLVISHPGSRATYCFLDAEGNIYRPASWKGPAKGIRSTLATVDMSKVDSYGSWLYR